MKAPRSVVAACALTIVFSATGCGGRSVEDRAREAEKATKESLGPDLEAVAVAQPIDPAVAKEVQQNLTVIHEYQGEVNGKLDSVTVNAIQAFQREAGLRDNGILDESTRSKLQAAAAAARQNGSAAKPAG
jgi:peptidoglycan hydrolase-like protein with peptidoglycan-binding domain